MTNDEELKWRTNRFTWRYIPLRYQSMVALIVSAFLYYNLFELLFQPINSSSGACGTLLRPVMDNGDDSPLGWVWDSGVSLWRMNDSLQCPRLMQGLWWEWFATIAGLALCGLVLRRAIKREQANS